MQDSARRGEEEEAPLGEAAPQGDGDCAAAESMSAARILYLFLANGRVLKMLPCCFSGTIHTMPAAAAAGGMQAIPGATPGGLQQRPCQTGQALMTFDRLPPVATRVPKAVGATTCLRRCRKMQEQGRPEARLRG